MTFDQPLWLKATEVAKSESLNIVIRMGVFHMIMSFSGSIGTVMSRGGLSDALETCYGPNAVIHMISGSSYSRSFRNVLWSECGHSYDQRLGPFEVICWLKHHYMCSFSDLYSVAIRGVADGKVA